MNETNARKLLHFKRLRDFYNRQYWKGGEGSHTNALGRFKE